jgi:hypothetical protein
MWTRDGLVPTDTTGQITCQEFASSHPLYVSAFTLLQSLLVITFLE